MPPEGLTPNPWSKLLLQAAEEIRASELRSSSLFLPLAVSIERMAAMPPGADLEAQIRGAARTIIDEVPSGEGIIPSFSLVLRGLHHLECQRRRETHAG